MHNEHLKYKFQLQTLLLNNGLDYNLDDINYKYTSVPVPKVHDMSIDNFVSYLVDCEKINDTHEPSFNVMKSLIERFPTKVSLKNVLINKNLSFLYTILNEYDDTGMRDIFTHKGSEISDPVNLYDNEIRQLGEEQIVALVKEKGGYFGSLENRSHSLSPSEEHYLVDESESKCSELSLTEQILKKGNFQYSKCPDEFKVNFTTFNLPFILIDIIESKVNISNEDFPLLKEIIVAIFSQLKNSIEDINFRKKFLGEEVVKQEIEAKANMIEIAKEFKPDDIRELKQFKKELADFADVKKLKGELETLKEQLTELVHSTRPTSLSGSLLAMEDELSDETYDKKKIKFLQSSKEKLTLSNIDQTLNLSKDTMGKLKVIQQNADKILRDKSSTEGNKKAFIVKGVTDVAEVIAPELNGIRDAVIYDTTGIRTKTTFEHTAHCIDFEETFITTMGEIDESQMDLM